MSAMSSLVGQFALAIPWLQLVAGHWNRLAVGMLTWTPTPTPVTPTACDGVAVPWLIAAALLLAEGAGAAAAGWALGVSGWASALAVNGMAMANTVATAATSILLAFIGDFLPSSIDHFSDRDR